MDYQQGIEFMKELCNEVQTGEPQSFNVGDLRIVYPGKKSEGDYILFRNGIAPTHENVVTYIYNAISSNKENFSKFLVELEHLYLYGLNSKYPFLPQKDKDLIFWITLQEEINYPQPRYNGRKLIYQRYFEGLLAAIGHIPIKEVIDRTNSNSIPVLYDLNRLSTTLYTPIFYNLN